MQAKINSVLGNNSNSYETSGAVYGSYYDIMLDFCTIPDQTVYEK